MAKNSIDVRRVTHAEKVMYTQEEIRLMITDSEGTLSDEEAMERIEEFVFSQKKAGSCSHRENRKMIERIFLSLRKEMDILQPYIDDKSISEIMVNGKDRIFIESSGTVRQPGIHDRIQLVYLPVYP